MKIFGLDCDSFKIAISMFDEDKLIGTSIIFSDKKLNSDKRAFELFNNFGLFLKSMKPDKVVIERSVYNQSFPATRTISEVIGYVKLVCDQNNIPYELVHNTSWKKVMVGKGNATKQEILDMVIKKYPEYQRTKITQDEADAILIAEYFIQKEKEKLIMDSNNG